VKQSLYASDVDWHIENSNLVPPNRLCVNLVAEHVGVVTMGLQLN